MPIPAELTELASKLNADDQAVLDQLLARNPSAATDLTAQASLYKAFVDGDDSRLPAAAHSTPQPGSPLADLTSLAATIEQRVAARYDGKVSALEAELQQRPKAADIDTRAREIAENFFKEHSQAFAADMLGRAAKASDEVYTIRRSHEREFGTELDTNKFTEYLNANPGKFASLSAAHDAFVQDDRIARRIEQGVAERVAAQQTTAVPGATLPQDGPLGSFIKHNEKFAAAANGTVARGDGLDAAVRAFAELRAGRQTH